MGTVVKDTDNQPSKDVLSDHVPTYMQDMMSGN